MTNYEKELQQLKSHDEVQFTQTLKSGYGFIVTAGHGYLIVPRSDKNFTLAKKIAEYGYVGKLAIYLEEDSEAGEDESLEADNIRYVYGIDYIYDAGGNPYKPTLKKKK